jgi:hypothetical protein
MIIIHCARVRVRATGARVWGGKRDVDAVDSTCFLPRVNSCSTPCTCFGPTGVYTCRSVPRRHREQRAVHSEMQHLAAGNNGPIKQV